MNSNDEKVLDLRCVNCGWGVERLYVQYSPGNIRLMKCDSCKAVADPYIECEFMILLIDLILHMTKAYRHLLYNTLNIEANGVKGIFWKSSLINFVLDVLMDVMLGNLMFISVVLLGTRVLLNSTLAITKYKDIMLAIMVSSHFKLFLMALMVWKFPSAALFIIDIFVLSSNCVALKVLTQSGITGCFGVCFSAHLAKFFTIHWISCWTRHPSLGPARTTL